MFNITIASTVHIHYRRPIPVKKQLTYGKQKRSHVQISTRHVNYKAEIYL